MAALGHQHATYVWYAGVTASFLLLRSLLTWLFQGNTLGCPSAGLWGQCTHPLIYLVPAPAPLGMYMYLCLHPGSAAMSALSYAVCICCLLDVWKHALFSLKYARMFSTELAYSQFSKYVEFNCMQSFAMRKILFLFHNLGIKLCMQKKWKPWEK